MKLGTAKVLSMASLLLGLAVGLLGHFLLEEGTSSYLLAEILTALLFIAGLLIVVAAGGCFTRCFSSRSAPAASAGWTTRTGMCLANAERKILLLQWTIRKILIYCAVK